MALYHNRILNQRASNRVKIKLLENNFSDFKNEKFLADWKQLYIACPWATPFQSPEFVIMWFDTYKGIYSPKIICLENDKQCLVGLLILAASRKNDQLVVAGAHQAEYQGWLASPDCPHDFIFKALVALMDARLAVETLKFKWLPKNTPIQFLFESKEFSKRVKLVCHQRPLMKIDSEEIEKSFRKKSNKSRFNRLSKIGNLEFRKVSDITEFEDIFNEIINFYDFRQGAINNSFPFLSDPQKKAFHIEWLKKHPDLLHITVITLDGNLVSAHIGVVGKDMVHLAILAYSPFYAAHSPGKLHLMQLARQLSSESIQYFDLTPGGDLWKERFANGHDEIYELVIYMSLSKKIIHDVKNWVLKPVKKCLKLVNITPSEIRQLFALIKRINTKSLINRLRFFLPETVEMRIYRHTLASPQQFASKGRMKKDNLTDILKFTVAESWQDKQSFCSSALGRLESGEHCYTISSDERLLHYGWLIEEQRESFVSEVQQSYQYPPNSVVFYDFYTDPSARGQGFYQESIKQMLSDAVKLENTEYIYISVKADNSTSLHDIEKLRFEYQESLFNFKLLGFSKKWKEYNFLNVGKSK